MFVEAWPNDVEHHEHKDSSCGCGHRVADLAFVIGSVEDQRAADNDKQNRNQNQRDAERGHCAPIQND